MLQIFIYSTNKIYGFMEVCMKCFTVFCIAAHGFRSFNCGIEKPKKLLPEIIKKHKNSNKE